MLRVPGPCIQSDGTLSFVEQIDKDALEIPELDAEPTQNLFEVYCS
jgi:hypothetical protein